MAAKTAEAKLARKAARVTKPTDLGLLALARSDPTAKFLKETRGNLGPDHQLDY